jgi:error-prone DNA polymerase
VRPVDVNASEVEATLEPGPRAAERVHDLHLSMQPDIRATHAIRLGLAQVKGLAEDDAKTIAARRPYASVRDLWLRTGLSPRVIERLADADAFGSLGLTRRQALWQAKALGRVGDRDDDLPLFRNAKQGVALPSPLAREVDREAVGRGRCAAPSQIPPSRPSPASGGGSPHREPAVQLPPMPLGEEVVNDYRFLELSLRAHPASFLRDDLAARRIIRNEELRTLPSGVRVTVSGLVTIRQRPGSAEGVVFMTIEDETGIANIVIWPSMFERFRPVILGARYVAVTGKVQSESGVIHVVCERLEDLTALLARLAQGPAVSSLARCDEVKRPVNELRALHTQRSRNAPLPPPAEMPDIASDLAVPARGSAHTPARRGGSRTA